MGGISALETQVDVSIFLILCGYLGVLRSIYINSLLIEKKKKEASERRKGRREGGKKRTVRCGELA